jgi:23S rRNA (cytosine1962-C5)-methyltransferase
MQIIATPGWEEYSLLDSGEGYRLEQFGKFRLIRPDPQCIWMRKLAPTEWRIADATFVRDKNGKEHWQTHSNIPAKWQMHYKELTFDVKLTPFKHTGIFPEQHLQWDWMTTHVQKAMKNNQQPQILNLFAYTGIASLVAAQNGCKVTHVDASSPSIGWARDNQTASHLEAKPIRWIKEDVLKFCQREVRRGNKYDGIIMDPPSYGHGPTGEVWEFNKSFPQLLTLCKELLSKKPLFIIINAYAISSSALMLENTVNDYIGKLGGEIEVGELCLQEKTAKRLLSTGIFARWSKQIYS